MNNNRLIEPGIYKARATQGEIGKNQNSGNDQAVVVFDILEGEFQGSTVRWYATLTEKTQRFVITGLTLCGWEGELGDDGKTMIGIDDNEVDIEVIHEEYQGKVFAKVRTVVDPDASIAGKQMTPAEQASFRARWGGAIEASTEARRAARAQGD